MTQKKIYFASDLHLGVPNAAESLEREKKFIKWLDHIAPDTKELYLLGDVFDFWFEYKRAIPKGFARLQGKLAEFTDSGIPVHFFAGNHDMWLNNYFSEELGLIVHLEPFETELFGKKFFLAHGDGLGPGDQNYKFLKKIFRNKWLKRSFGLVHPNTGIRIAQYFSKRSRKGNAHLDQTDYGENEFLLLFSKEYLGKHPDISYFVYGHRHLPVNNEFAPGKHYINLGDWIGHNTFLQADGEGVRLLRYHPGAVEPFSAL